MLFTGLWTIDYGDGDAHGFLGEGKRTGAIIATGIYEPLQLDY